METTTLKQQLESRVQTWSGIFVSSLDNGTTIIEYRGNPLARFPSEDSIEILLCGNMKDRLIVEELLMPDGMWLTGKNNHLIVDLRLPGGIEEAVRALLNAYIYAQSQREAECKLDEEILKKDAECAKVKSEIKQHRKRLEEKRGIPAT